MDDGVQNVELRTARRAIGRARLTPVDACVLGSAADCTVRLVGRGVRTHHARIVSREGRLLIEPIEQAPLILNGCLLKHASPINGGDWMVLGETPVQIALDEASAPAPHSQPSVQSVATEILVGRQHDCGLAIDSPQISRHHARLSIREGQVWLEDLGSTNGTSVNGRRIRRAVMLSPGDRVAFASLVFVFTGSALEPAESGNRVRVEVRGLVKEVRDRSTGAPRRLLDDINLVIDPGEFVVIFGTSGSGKSTLLDALNGRRPASEGQVCYNGIELYGAFDQFRSGIGYVPQQDIVHRKISVRHALRYTARLRLPPDTSGAEIDTLIDRVLDRVGLSDKATLAVDTPEPLSGGQLKRVSLAVELVANPHILFLDEATSGLDAGTDKKMMRLFASLAADGKTVVCVTHSLENIDCCHRVALLHRGALVYYGPPDEAADYFGVERLSDVYEMLERADAAHWRERFRHSPQYRTHVAERLSHSAGHEVAPPPTRPARRRLSPWAWMSQLATLARRNLDLLLSDRINLLVLLAQAPLIALIVGAIFSLDGTPPERAVAESQIAFVLVLSAIWFGCINSAREIVKELPVYRRERSVILRIPPYLGSKLLPLALLCLAQCASFLGIVTLMLDFQGQFLERLATLFMAGFAATAMGLAISALVNTNDKAIAALPLLLIPQFILSNAVVALSGASESVAQFSVIAYWALDALRSTLSPELLELRDPAGVALIALHGEWNTDMQALGALAAGFLLLTALALRLRDRRL